MQDDRRRTLDALQEHFLEEAVDHLVAAGLIDRRAVDHGTAEIAGRWSNGTLDALAKELEALRGQAARQRKRAAEQGEEPAHAEERDEAVVQLDERRRRSAGDELATVAAALDSAQRALAGALAALALARERRWTPPSPARLGDGGFGELELCERRLGNSVVYALRGEVDLATVGALRDALERASGAAEADVLVDLTDVGFMDSTGLTTLVGAHQAIAAQGRRFAVICPDGAVHRALELAGLDRVMTIFGDQASAQAR